MSLSQLLQLDMPFPAWLHFHRGPAVTPGLQPDQGDRADSGAQALLSWIH